MKSEVELTKLQKAMFYVAWLLCLNIALPFSGERLGVLSLLLFLLWLIDGNLRQKLLQLGQNKPFIILMLMLGFSILSLSWTDYLYTGYRTLSAYKYYLFIMPPLITSIPKEKVSSLLFAFVLGVLIHSVAAYSVFFFHFSGYPWQRVYLPWAVYGPFTAFAALYFLNKFLCDISPSFRQIVNLILSIILIILLFIMYGRSGKLIFIIGLLVLFYLHYKSLNFKIWQKSILLIILVTVVTSITILTFNNKHTKNRILAIKVQLINVLENRDYTGSIGARAGLAMLGLEAAKQHPLFGAGTGDLRDETQRIIERGKHQEFYTLGYWDGVHSQYIAYLVRYGLVGISLLFIYIYLFFFLDIDYKEYKILSIIFVTLFSVNFMTDEILSMKPYNTFFPVMSALFLNLARRQTTST